MKKSGVVGFISSLFSFSLSAQKVPCQLPKSILIQSAFDTVFVAKCALFVAVLLLGTLFFGQLLKIVFKLPTIAGQIIGGIILGPTFLDIQHFSLFIKKIEIADMISQEMYSVVPSDLFVFFILLLSSAFTVAYLLWLAGYETNIRDLLKVGATAVGAGFFGALFSIITIISVILFLYPGEFPFVTIIGIGIVFAATSVSIPVAMLVSSNKMHLKSSQATLGAAIVDDILSVILLSIFIMSVQSGLFGVCEFASSGHNCSIGKALLFMVASFSVILSFGYFLIPPLMRVLQNRKMTYLMAAVATATMLIYFSFAELVGGFAGITGAYFAGVFQRVSDTKRTAEKVCAPFVNAVLLPLFLGSIGLQLDLHILTKDQWILVVILLICSIVAKLVGCGLAAGISNLSCRRKQNKWSLVETYLFGSSMVARGEVGLVISTILRGAHIITSDMYVLCVVVIVLSAIVAPLMLSLGFAHFEKKELKGIFRLKLGTFEVVGTSQMFNSLVGHLEADMGLKTTIQMSEGRKIIDLEGDRVKIILSPEEGIIFEGNRNKIIEIVSEFKQTVLQDLEKISLH